MSLFAVALLTLTRFLPFAEGVLAPNFLAESAEVLLPSTGNAVLRIQSLRDGQTLYLLEDEVRLEKTLSVDASHVTIHGVSGRTRVATPESKGVRPSPRGTNVTLVSLEFFGCQKRSALTAVGPEDPTPCGGGSQAACEPECASREWRKEVRIDSCRFRNNTHSRGAAVSVARARLTVTNSTYEYNHATESGTIHAKSCRVEIENSSFRNNDVKANGGSIVAFDSEVEVKNVKFGGNSAEEEGGALSLKRSSLTLKHVTFIRNSAKNGGALSVWDSSVKADGVAFTENSAQGLGGAIDLRRSNATLRAINFANNSAPSGGALYARGPETDPAEDSSDPSIGPPLTLHSNLNLQAVECVNNSAGHGGGIWMAACNATVQNVLFSGNVARSFGGAFALRKSATTMQRINFINNTASSGGAVWTKETDVTMEHVLFAENNATLKGGAISLMSSYSNVQDTQFMNNSGGKGGALFVSSSSTTVVNVTFSKNVAGSLGGGLRLWRSDVMVKESQFLDNKALQGGALFVSESEVTMERATLAGNIAERWGGALRMSDANGRMKNVVFGNNTAGGGGAIYAFGSEVMTVQKATFAGNRARDSHGGAVLFLKTNATVAAAKFSNNSAQEGGALWIKESNMTVRSVSFDANSATTLGGAFALSKSVVILEGNDFTDNVARHDGGAVYAASSETMTMKHNSFFRNFAKIGGAVVLRKANATAIDIKFSNNSAQEGGALWIKEAGLRMKRASFSMNLAETSGGAFALVNSTMLLERSNFASNFANAGAAIWTKETNMHLHSVSFTGNSARPWEEAPRMATFNRTVQNVTTSSSTASYGGALCVLASKTTTVENVTFADNAAENGGGAFAMRASAVTIKDAKFTNNTARQGAALLAKERVNMVVERVLFDRNHDASWGGAIRLLQSKKAILKDVVFRNNEANQGGAIWASDSEMEVMGAVFAGNAANATGGAVVLRRINGTVRNAEFSRNRADIGGALWIREGRPAFLNVSFSENVAESKGGALLLRQCTMTMNGSHFTNNNATRGGAVYANEANSRLKNVNFTGNVADRQGGALRLSGVFTAALTEVRLENNSAEAGGAVNLMGLSESDARLITFARNPGKRKGKSTESLAKSILTLSGVFFVGNNATVGGGICATQRAKLHSVQDDPQINEFRENTAVDGGAVFCNACVLDLQSRAKYEGNFALRSGGGVNVKSSPNATMACADFQQNVASFGGAMRISNCRSFSLGESTKCETSFTKNLAIDGGALHVEYTNSVENNKIQHSRFERSRFEHNRALLQTDMSTVSDVPALKRWVEGLEAISAEKEPGWLTCTDCLRGRGGALFFNLHALSTSVNVNIGLDDFRISNNYASFGGGSYVDMPRRNGARVAHHWCDDPVTDQDQEQEQPGCLYLHYSGVQLKNNYAKSAGGGWFMSGSENPWSFCKESDRNSRKHSDRDSSSSCFTLQANGIGAGGYGPDLATSSASLHWRNITGELKNLQSGQRFETKAKNVTDSNNQPSSKPGIMVDVYDALDQIVTAGPDSKRLVELRSDWIFGQHEYRAENGTIIINKTIVLGVDIVGTLKLTLEGVKGVSTYLNFTTKPCAEGEIKGPLNLTCIHCAQHLYTFNASDDCRICEKHAICNKTTGMVPDEGYWHSTPFSPVIRKCPLEEACVMPNRTALLLDYYKNYSFIYSKMEELRANQKYTTIKNYSSDYVQCAEGYTGILCGECEDGYGHSSGRECEPCDDDLATTRSVITVATFVLFLAVGVKVGLEIDGVKKDVAFALVEEKRRVRMIIDRASREASNNAPSSSQEGGSETGNESVIANNRDQVQISRTSSRVSAGVQDEETSGSSEDNAPQPRPPRIPRSTEHIEYSESDEGSSNDVSKEAMEAAGVFSETYNILFNYVQLNSIALFLGVNWKGALDRLLSLQSRMGRMLDAGLYPFDCSFSDRDHDVGTPNSILVVLYRAAFPLITAVLYLIIIQIWAWFRGEKKTSKYEIDHIPPLKLVFCVVYFSYCIDIISDLLRVTNCIHLTPAAPDHPYAAYEILEERFVWADDTSVTCHEGAHFWALIVAGFGLAISLGIIMFSVIALRWGKKQGKLNDTKFCLSYGFLYFKYRTEGLALYWEAILAIRSTLFAAISVYSQTRETTDAEIGLFAIVIVAAITMQEIVKPFNQENLRTAFPSYAGGNLRYFGAQSLADKWVALNKNVTLNGLESASLFMSLSLFLTAMSINDHEASNTQEYILLLSCFILNTLFSAFMLYRISCCIHHCFDVSAQDKGIRFHANHRTVDEDRDTWLLWKVWALFVRPKIERHRLAIPLLRAPAPSIPERV